MCSEHEQRLKDIIDICDTYTENYERDDFDPKEVLDQIREIALGRGEQEDRK